MSLREKIDPYCASDADREQILKIIDYEYHKDKNGKLRRRRKKMENSG